MRMQQVSRTRFFLLFTMFTAVSTGKLPPRTSVRPIGMDISYITSCKCDHNVGKEINRQSKAFFM